MLRSGGYLRIISPGTINDKTVRHLGPLRVECKRANSKRARWAQTRAAGQVRPVPLEEHGVSAPVLFPQGDQEALGGQERHEEHEENHAPELLQVREQHLQSFTKGG